MNDRDASDSDARGGAPVGTADTELVTVCVAQLRDGGPLPMNFIVLPQETPAVPAPPSPGPARAAPRRTDELPVLTVRAEPQTDAQPVEVAAEDSMLDPFAPTVFGPRLNRQPHSQPLYADPDSAPASVLAAASAGTAKKKSVRWLLTVALLLALAAGAWWWIGRYGPVWPWDVWTVRLKEGRPAAGPRVDLAGLATSINQP